MPIGRTILFVTVMTLGLAGLHLYVYLRVTRTLPFADPKTLKVVFSCLFALLWLSFPLERLVPTSVSTPLLWISYSWLGSLILLVSAYVGSDLFRLLLHGVSPALPVDNDRRTWLFRVADVAALGVGTSLSGFSLFQGVRKPIVRNVQVTLDKWPQSLLGFRIVQLTDVHIGPMLRKDWLADIVKRVLALSPDLIVITGDLVDGSVQQLRHHVAPLADLRAPHGVFFVTGNHEYYSGVDAWLAEVTRLGIRVLRNEHVTLSAPSGTQPGPEPTGFDLVGVDDFHAHMFPGHGADLTKALAGRDDRRPAVLLAHQPAAVLEAAERGIDLQLSGHTHAGQIWPWGYLVRLQQPYVFGLHRLRSTQIYVSAGTGYWGPPMRLGSQSEITLITLSPQQKP
ncbi:MAG TPA: metallophosphoesterase [Pseudomonadota bacterium]|nr:metallophosphoesterase [Pseudomonadota bacterium]